jgi:RNA polymerase sigma-70 factor (ECF subfamily)
LAQDALYGHEPDSDMELVRRVRQGDEAAFRRVVDIHGPRLYLLAVSMLGNREDAQDVVQETFVGAFRGLRGFQGRSTVKTWLTRILMNNVADLRRRRHLRKTLPFDEAAEQLGASPAWRVTETGRADMRMDIAAVVGRLPEEHRAVIVLREMQGMTYEEIAAALGVPRGTVESRLFRARQKLKEILGDYLA